jgi:hypothetical protein
MRGRALVGLALVFVAYAETACVVLVHPKQSKLGQVIGVVNEPTSASLHITTTNQAARDIQTDAATRYTKWLTHQPWRIDRLITRKSLTVGRCIKITVRNDNPSIASRIEVSLDPPGTIDDPCRRIR